MVWQCFLCFLQFSSHEQTAQILDVKRGHPADGANLNGTDRSLQCYVPGLKYTGDIEAPVFGAVDAPVLAREKIAIHTQPLSS